MTGSETQPEVLIVGAGAVGLMLACDLLQQGITVQVIDRRETLDDNDPHSRAVLIWPRMLELLRRIGVVDDLVELGFPITGVSYFSGGRRLGTVPMDGLGTTSPFTLSLPQREVERVLRRRFEELGGTVGLELTLTELDLSGPDPAAVVRDARGDLRTMRARWLIGADGVGSRTRRLLGLAYPGRPFEMGISIGDFPVTGPVGSHVEYHYSRNGLLPLIPMGRGVGRLASIVPPVGDGWQSFTHRDLQAIVAKRASLPYRIGAPFWVRTFQPRPGIAEQFRVGRCLLAGDSAHCVVPLGGQGLNLGIQDAFNLSWKLGGVLRGRFHEDILDTYDTERRAAAQQVTTVVMLQVLAARQLRRWPSLLRDTLISVGRRLGLLDRLAAPLLSQVGLGYGPVQQRSLLRPPSRRALPGQRVPVAPHSPADEPADRPVLDPVRFTLLLWPGHRAPRNWAATADRVRAKVGGQVAVRDLAAESEQSRRTVGAALGRRPVLALVRPDGHLAHLSRTDRPESVEEYLRRLRPSAQRPELPMYQGLSGPVAPLP